MEQRTLRELITRFPDLRIAVVGDLMVDRFIYGDVRRISPEAPVPVLLVSDTAVQPGGAANVAANILALGGQVSLFGAAGRDSAGRELRETLYGLGGERIDLTGVLSPLDYVTTVKTRVVARSQQMLRIDEEDPSVISSDLRENLTRRIMENLRSFHLILISDYAKGILSSELASGIIAGAGSVGCEVLVDPKPSGGVDYAGADLIKPNLGEALQMCKTASADSDAQMQQVCKALLIRTGARNVAVTAGKRGIYLLADGEFERIDGHERAVYDVAGAGDTTLSALALARAAGACWHDAAYLGNLAGSLAITKVGVATVSADELVSELETEAQGQRDA